MIVDPLTGERILAGSTRHERPNEFRNGPEARCPFCPGNESLTPPERARRGDGSTWTARAFANKFPAIEPPEGDHEVIVDSPGHDDEVTLDGVHLWRERYADALRRFPSSYPVLFKNSGAYAGATIAHPHTQLIVIPERPARWNATAPTERCVLCDERDEAAGGDRAVHRGTYVDAFVRESNRFASALTLLPHRCIPSLLDASAEVWEEMARILRRAIDGMRSAESASVPFNLLVLSSPHEPRFHWHAELIVRTNTLAGFELATGMFIRGATAQESAVLWRRMIAPPDGSL